MPENNKFCPLPWINTSVRNNGDLRVCCQANASTSKGIYRKENSEPYNVVNDSIEESRNSKLANEIRKSMLENKTHEACIRCDSEDASGIKSRRNYEGLNWGSYFNLDDAKSVTDKDGSIKDVNAVYYDLRFGNLCNLKCRMCGPTDSSAWYDDFVKVWGGTSYDDSHGKVNLVLNNKGKYETKQHDYDWVESQNFWDQLKGNIHNIKRIHTVGGEPLMIDQQYNLLQQCIDEGVAKNIIVEYNSNVTNIPNRAWDIWKHFKQIEIGASIDGFGSINDYIRHPSKFKAIDKNLHRLDKAEGNFNAWISCTVQAYNAYHLPDFMKWKLEQGFVRLNTFASRRIITTHPLHNPKHLSIQIFPEAMKYDIAKKYYAFYEWLEKWMEKQDLTDKIEDQYRRCAHDILGSYTDLMLKEDLSEHMHKFIQYTERLDDIRDETLEDSIPELYFAMKKFC